MATAAALLLARCVPSSSRRIALRNVQRNSARVTLPTKMSSRLFTFHPERSTGGDLLSKLGDRVRGHVLSFLPADEAALLSSRWRHVFAAVHTVSLDEPAPPFREGDQWVSYAVRQAAVLFSCAVLRSLSLGSCSLALPAKVDLPSLEIQLMREIKGWVMNKSANTQFL